MSEQAPVCRICPLCGQTAHEGPCYKDLREEWRRKRVEEKLKRYLSRAGVTTEIDG